MTNLERTRYAKIYLEKLARGINPIDNTPVDENDVVNNISISRCFLFVSDILEKVIDNNGDIGSGKNKKPFNISREELNEFKFSDTPMTITQITKSINELTDMFDKKKLMLKNIVDWLVNSDILRVEELSDGRTRKRPTSIGTSIGIFTEERIGKQGNYMAVLYNKTAQQFIIDNMEAIIAGIPE